MNYAELDFITTQASIISYQHTITMSQPHRWDWTIKFKDGHIDTPTLAPGHDNLVKWIKSTQTLNELLF